MTRDDLATDFPKVWGLLPQWLIEGHTTAELLELIASFFFPLPHRLVRHAARKLSEGNPAAAQQLLVAALPRLLDEPCDDDDALFDAEG